MLKTQVESSRLLSQGQRVAGSAMGLTSILRSRDSIHPFSFCLGLTQMCIVSTHSHTSPSMHIYAQTHILTHPTAHSHVHTHVTHSRGHTCTYMYLPHTLPLSHLTNPSPHSLKPSPLSKWFLPCTCATRAWCPETSTDHAAGVAALLLSPSLTRTPVSRIPSLLCC